MISIFNEKKILTKFGLGLCILLIFISIYTLFYLYKSIKIDYPKKLIENYNDSLPDPTKLANQIPDGEDYLYPVYSLNEMCESQGLQPSLVNKLCLMKDGTYKPLSNCKCENDDGTCAICYPEIKIDRTGRSIIYNADQLE